MLSAIALLFEGLNGDRLSYSPKKPWDRGIAFSLCRAKKGRSALYPQKGDNLIFTDNVVAILVLP